MKHIMIPQNYDRLLLLSKITFPIRLKQLMDRDRVKDKDVIHSLSITSLSLRRYKQGKHLPKQDTLLAIACYFNVPIDVLIGHDQLTLLYSVPIVQYTKEPLGDIKSELNHAFVTAYGIDPLLAINHWKKEIEVLES